MKTFLHILLYLATTALFTFLYWDDQATSLWGSILMACVTSSIILLPIPTRWGKAGYVGFGLIICLSIGLFGYLERELTIGNCILYSMGASTIIVLVKYGVEKYNANRSS